jgi:tRNA (cytidine/uridine-2'-O-)-methyltransferase
MRVIVCRPEIPQNVGALLRLGACWGIAMDFIGPFPFIWSDRHLKRAGLDYIPDAVYTRHTSWMAFQQAPQFTVRKIALIPSAAVSYVDFSFHRDDALMVGCESHGFTSEEEKSADAAVSIPLQKGQRSLNMAMACAIVLSEALRQTHYFHHDFPKTLYS